MKHTLRILCGMCCLLLLSCVKDNLEYDSGADLQVGEQIPSFTVQMNDGSSFFSDDLSGEISLLLFFNTHCPDCQKELPVIQRIYSEWGDRIRLVAISCEEEEASIAHYWQQNQLTIPYSAQKDRKVYALFARTSIPRVYVVDQNLFIRRIYTDNPLANYESLSADLTELVDEQNSDK